MRGKELKEYQEEQIKGHFNTERYALTTPGYINLMKHLRSLLPENGKVLEIGTNSGFEATMIQTENRSVIGIDLGKKFIEKAKSRGIDAFVMDMHELKFNDNEFDAVYVNNTLEHAYNPKKVLSEIFRVLKKNGKMIVCIPADYKNKNYYPTEGWNSELHLWKPDRDEFQKIIVNAGFKSVTTNEWDGDIMFGLKNKASFDKYLVAECIKL